MEDRKIDTAINYYNEKINSLMIELNSRNNLTASIVISHAEELENAIIKREALNIAKNN